MGANKTWMGRNHWYAKGGLLLITGALALTRIPVLVGLFVAMATWTLLVSLFALKAAHWTRSRRSQYAKMPQAQRDEMQRQMIYAHEELDRQTHTLTNVTGMLPKQRAVYQADVKRRDTAAGAIMLHEQWQSELLGVPSRSLPEVRRYWVERDPVWLTAETEQQQKAERRDREWAAKRSRTS